MVSRGTWGVAEAPGGDGLVFSAALWPKPHIFVCWPVTIGDGSRPSTRPHPKIIVFVFEYRVSGNLRDTGYRFISSRHLVPSKPGQKSLKSSSRSTITSQTVVTTSKYCYCTQYGALSKAESFSHLRVPPDSMRPVYYIQGPGL